MALTYRGYPPVDIGRYLDELKYMERCYICGRQFIPEDDCPLCDDCADAEDQSSQDHQDEVAVALAATNGTL